MTSHSDSPYKDSFQFRDFVHIFNQIIEILKEFQKNYDKKLNITKLTKFLNIPHSEEEEVLTLLLKFQELFEDVFCEYRIKKKRENNIVYLVAKNKFDRIDRIHKSLSSTHIKLINDIIYTFKNINRGKGFDIKKTETGLLQNLKQLCSEHPYLFESNGNGMIYPSKLGLRLGDQIISYNKSNQRINSFTIQNYIVEVIEEDG